MKQLTLLYLVKDKQVLLALKKRGPGAGFWNGVGGKVEPGESAAEAAARECQEEIEVTPTNYYKVAELLFDEVFGDNREQVNIHAYICNSWNGKPTETDEMNPKWFILDALPSANMWPADSMWLPLVLEGKKIKAKFILDDKNLVVSKQITYLANDLNKQA